MNALNEAGPASVGPARNELRQIALHWLAEGNPQEKVRGVRELREAWDGGLLSLDTASAIEATLPLPGRPSRPELVPPLAVQHRSMRSPEGRAALVHALAHIEFNAINLALDALWRFAGMPPAYYADWLLVASEEAAHFAMLANHLASLGYSYGDFPAHNSLWDMADATSGDVMARMALVPRTLEARGLDASPAVHAKLIQAGDTAAADIVSVILRDEIGHVAIGNRWYFWLCTQRGAEPVAAFDALCKQFRAPVMRGPFNIEARRAAGFTEAELDELMRRTTTPSRTANVTS